MSAFSKGDRVEWRGCWSEGRLGVLLTDAVSDDPHTVVLVNWDNGGQETVKIGALRKVEPEDKDDLYVEPEPLKEGDAVRALAQAIIWTREYVGEATLPAMKGWSWYDALREYAPEFLPEEPTQCTSLYEYEEGKYVRCCRASGHANPGHQGYGKGWLAESARLADGGAS